MFKTNTSVIDYQVWLEILLYFCKPTRIGVLSSQKRSITMLMPCKFHSWIPQIQAATWLHVVQVIIAFCYKFLISHLEKLILLFSWASCCIGNEIKNLLIESCVFGNLCTVTLSFVIKGSKFVYLFYKPERPHIFAWNVHHILNSLYCLFLFK